MEENFLIQKKALILTMNPSLSVCIPHPVQPGLRLGPLIHDSRIRAQIDTVGDRYSSLKYHWLKNIGLLLLNHCK